jgi:hypothetical protein
MDSDTERSVGDFSNRADMYLTRNYQAPVHRLGGSMTRQKIQRDAFFTISSKSASQKIPSGRTLLYEARLVKSLVWSDWFIPLFGFSQSILFASNLRPIKLYDDTHSYERAFPLSLQCELSPRQIRTNFKLE